MYNNVARILLAIFSVGEVRVDVHVSIRVQIIILRLSPSPDTDCVYDKKPRDGNTVHV